MFNFFKEKLKKTVSRFSKKLEEDDVEDVLDESEIVENISLPPENTENDNSDEIISEPVIEKSEDDEEVIEPVKEEIKVIAENYEVKEEPSEIVKLSSEGGSVKIDEEIIPEPVIKKIQDKPIQNDDKPRGFFSKFKKAFKKEDSAKQISEIIKPENIIEEDVGGFFSKVKQKISTSKINDTKFEDLFFELEIVLLENNVAVEVINKIKDDLKNEIVDNAIKRGQIEKLIISRLKQSIVEVLDIPKLDVFERIANKKPFVIVFVGINGSGKTTTIAKFVKLLQNHNLKSVIAASDTFRAAAIDQLEEHANKLGTKLIKQDYGADPAAVAFDAVKYAEAHNVDVVLIDTAGRLHSNINLVDEMKKIVRVSKPDLKIFVGESITGNDCVEQAYKFNEAIGIDGIILSKADIDEKGGAAISVSYVTKKPILFLGVGQEYNDLKEFDSKLILDNLEL